VTAGPEDLHHEAARRLRTWAAGDEAGLLAADVDDLVDQLVQTGTRLLDVCDAEGEPVDGPLSLLIDAAFLYQYRALCLAKADQRDQSRALLKHAGFIGLTVALRRADAIPDALRPSVALAASSWAGELLERVVTTGAQELLDESIKCARLAIRMALRQRPTTMRTLATALATRFERSGMPDDLDEALTIYRRLVDAPEGSSEDLHNLGVALRTRFDFKGRPTDLDEAIDVLTRALSTAGEHRSAMYATNLATARQLRFERDGDVDNLRGAIAELRGAVTGTAEHDRQLPVRLSAMGVSLRALYDETGNRQHLEEAVAAHLRASETVDADRPEAPGIWMNLGNSLRAQFELTGNLDDLTAAIDRTSAAADTLPPSHPGQARLRSNLGSMLRVRYEHRGAPGDLEAALQHHLMATR
jgi:tetratricopeptide (TPR) repeat protein